MIKEKQQFSLPNHPFLGKDHDPTRILHELFSSYTVEDIRIIMWEKLKAELASGYYKSQLEINNAIFFYETLVISLEAVYLLHNKPEKKVVKRKPK